MVYEILIHVPSRLMCGEEYAICREDVASIDAGIRTFQEINEIK